MGNRSRDCHEHDRLPGGGEVKIREDVGDVIQARLEVRDCERNIAEREAQIVELTNQVLAWKRHLVDKQTMLAGLKGEQPDPRD